MLNIEIIRNYCLSKKCVTESFPFDESTLVFKVCNKMFCLADINPPISVNLKCNPEDAIELREKYEAVFPGYHMNKKHWNTIMVNDIHNPQLIWKWIDNSYNLIVGGLTQKVREELQNF